MRRWAAAGRIGIWPRGLIGRVTVVLLAAMLVEFIGSTIFYEQAGSYIVVDAHVGAVAQQLATDGRLLAGTAPADRARLARMLSSPGLRLQWRASPRNATAPAAAEPSDVTLLHQRMLTLEPRLRAYDLAFDGTGSSDVAGHLRLADGSPLGFVAPDILVRPPVTRGLLSATVLALCVLLGAVMLVRTLSLPLRAVARLADAIGHGPPVPVPASILSSGPNEVRHLARAMVAMQGRISRLLADRTEALAAVSHDLRTPLSRLRLRAGFVEDAEAQAAIEADVAEMEAMVDSVLAYLAGENDPEPKCRVDLASLLATLVDDATDAGARAFYHGPDHAPALLRPLAMKRVFSNLIGNALTYAGSAFVSLMVEEQAIRVVIEDDGPGIPDAELERVLTPFYRLEGSRSRSTGGLGLGLAIVQREVQREGGAFHLANRGGGGLRASITL